MDWLIPLLTSLHLLVPIYWLGGDLGAFYSARFLVDPARAPGERLMALTILNNIDMAPRTALILAFPTGFTLAVLKGWLALSHGWLGLAWVLALSWLALAWAVHLRHGPEGAALKRLDLAVRYGVLTGLVLAGGAGVAGVLPLPLFIALKLLALALCVALGLLVRVQLAPAIPPILALRHGASDEGNQIIASTIARTARSVQFLWVVVLCACLLGLGKPV